MRHRQRFLMYCMVPLLSFLTGGCLLPTENVLYEGTYHGMNYVVKAHETHTVNGSRTDWILKLEGHPELPIIITRRWGTSIKPDGIVSTDWGPPYSDSIYGKSERMYLGNAPAYSNKGDDYTDSVARQHDYTLLYMPLGSTIQDFAAYSALLKAEWAAVDKTLASDDASYFPHLIGLVVAPREQFIQRFRGSKNGGKYVLRIDPDGYVNFGLDDGSAEGNHMRHCVVQMPQKEILRHTLYGIDDNGWQSADLRTLKDPDGKSVETYFKVKD